MVLNDEGRLVIPTQYQIEATLGFQLSAEGVEMLQDMRVAAAELQASVVQTEPKDPAAPAAGGAGSGQDAKSGPPVGGTTPAPTPPTPAPAQEQEQDPITPGEAAVTAMEDTAFAAAGHVLVKEVALPPGNHTSCTNVKVVLSRNKNGAPEGRDVWLSNKGTKDLSLPASMYLGTLGAGTFPPGTQTGDKKHTWKWSRLTSFKGVAEDSQMCYVEDQKSGGSGSSKPTLYCLADIEKHLGRLSHCMDIT